MRRLSARRLGRWAWPLTLVQFVLTIRRHLEQTSPEDRKALRDLLRQSGGRPASREILRAAQRLRPLTLLRALLTDVVRPGRPR